MNKDNNLIELHELDNPLNQLPSEGCFVFSLNESGKGTEFLSIAVPCVM